MLFDNLWLTFSTGGWTMIPIFLVGAYGIYLLLRTYQALSGDLYRSDYTALMKTCVEALHQSSSLPSKKQLPGIVGYSYGQVLKYKNLSEEKLRRKLNEVLFFPIESLDKHLSMTGVCAAAAPLLGLLGTVTGMVHTFQRITLFGNSNPLLLADGISEALITTQSGLLIAFPLLLLKRRIEGRIAWVKSRIELGITELMNEIYATDQKEIA